jgi:3',5'-cyclic AMP phosphodiesterase CpdA
VDLTTLAPDEAVFFDGGEPTHLVDLEPDTVYDDLDGLPAFRTLPRPGGSLLATLTTVNAVHFGEVECGIDSGGGGPTFVALEGEGPSPETMNRGAIDEMAAIEPDLVVVKGDLTSDALPEQIEAFERFYGGAFGDRLLWVRGNHESYHSLQYAAVPFQERTLPGVTVALLDTSRDGQTNGGVSTEQLEWLDELGARADRPVLVMGHHHAWNPEATTRSSDYFGIVPDDTERLVEVFARRPRLVGYFAGHTHRNRVRRFRATGSRPWVEVSCVKDYPGAWAEYRVYEGGIVQVFRRISSPEALVWSERTKAMFAGLYHDYAFGSVEDRNFVIDV